MSAPPTITQFSLNRAGTVWYNARLAKPGRRRVMSKVCQVTGKRPVSGNNVSHANNKTKRRFQPNVHDHRFWLENEQRFVKLRVSAKGMHIINKKDIEQVVNNLRTSGQKI